MQEEGIGAVVLLSWLSERQRAFLPQPGKVRKGDSKQTIEHQRAFPLPFGERVRESG